MLEFETHPPLLHSLLYLSPSLPPTPIILGATPPRDLQIYRFLYYLHIVYIGILIGMSTLRNNVRNKGNKKLRN